MEYKKIGEVTSLIFSGGTPDTRKPEYWNGDINWLSSGETRNRFITKTEKKITVEGVKNSSTRLVKEKDVVIASAGQGYTRGQTSYCLTDTYINQSILALRANEEIILPLFLFYNLSSRYDELRAISDSNSSRGSLTSKLLRELPILLPSIEKQKSIVNILYKIDQKITLNEEMIFNIKQIGESLFKHWFIKFEFPNEYGESYFSSGGKMVESELGLIPLDWNLGSLSDLGKIVGGGTPSKKIEEYYTNDGISWITPKDLSNNKSIYLYKGAIDITTEALKKSSANLLPENTVLFSSRAPIGYIAIAGKNVTTNQGFKSIIPNKEVPKEYVYFLLKHLTPTIESNAGGSTFKEISGSGMNGIKTILPTSKVLSNFRENIAPLFEKIKILEEENRALSNLKETLLPKFLSGEIEVFSDLLEVNEYVSIP